MLNPLSVDNSIDSQLMPNPPRTEREVRLASPTSPRSDRVEILDVSSNSHLAADVSAYRSAHIDIKDVIAFAALKMKDIYDFHHKPMFFKVGDQVNLRLHRGYRVSAIKSKKLGPQFIGSFPVIERIGRLTYRLRLSPIMKIHDVISVPHLEPVTDPAKDPYQRRRPSMSAVVIDGEEKYQVEKLLQKRRVRRGRE